MRKLSLDNLNKFFAAVADTKTLYLPVDQKDGSAKYAKWAEGTEWSNALNTVRSPKDLFFPQTEDLMEFKTEGMVLGVGVNMFRIAGPVLVYGVASSVIYGVIYYFLK